MRNAPRGPRFGLKQACRMPAKLVRAKPSRSLGNFLYPISFKKRDLSFISPIYPGLKPGAIQAMSFQDRNKLGIWIF